MKLENLLKNKDSKERASLKAKEIAKVAFRGKYKKDKLEIEIIDIQEIEGGVSVYAKAWNGKKQLGFGKDGSVEIERFNIYNPPILVSDENGDIERKIVDEETREITIEKYREDAEEAVKQVIEHNISLVAKSEDNIQKGKVGNTTSTIYPTTDGSTGQEAGGNWNFCHDKTVGNVLQQDIATNQASEARRVSGSDFRIGRWGVKFDTSVIGTDDIDTAVLSFKLWRNESNQAHGLVQFTPANTSTFALADYSQFGATNNPTEGATRVTPTNTSSYNALTLNATGIGWINKTGDTLFGIRMEKDMDDVQPTSIGRNGIRGAATSGTTSDPKLVVEHSSSGTTFVASMQII